MTLAEIGKDLAPGNFMQSYMLSLDLDGDFV